MNTVRQMEKPATKYLVATIVVAAIVAAGAYAITVPDSVENDYYMRGDQHTVNDFTAYRLGLSQSSTEQSFTTSQDEGFFGTLSDVYWGIRVFRRTGDGQTEEITGGNPVAEVTRQGSTGQGIQSAQWNPPETALDSDDALIIRVYQSIGSGNYQKAAEFVTSPLNASRLNSEEWTVNYYTQLANTGGGANPVTEATFYWGTSTYNSGIQGLNYSVARVEAQQTEPSIREETWPGQEFTQTVQIACRASTCENVEIVPQACQGSACSAFRDAQSFKGISWSQNSYGAGDMIRGETLTKSFTVTAEDEGDYRIRAETKSGNVASESTSSQRVDVSVANVELSDLKHENWVEHGVLQYETGDTIEFLNTTLRSEDQYSYWLAATGDPSIIKDENGTSTDITGRAGAPTNGILSGDSNERGYFLGGDNGELTKWNGTFTDIFTPSSDGINALSANSTHMFVGTADPQGYLYNFETGNYKQLGITSATPVSAANSYGTQKGVDYFLVGTESPSVLRVKGTNVKDITPSFIQDTVRGLATNGTHFIIGDLSGNAGIYNGSSSKDISGAIGLEGSYSIRSAEWGGFAQDEEVTNFWLVGGGSGRLVKYYPNGTSDDLSGTLPGSWQVEEITYSSETQKFYIGGGSGNMYSYTQKGFTDVTPSVFSSNTGTVQEIAYAQGEGGKAYNATLTPTFEDPGGNTAVWRPQSTSSCGNISKGKNCEREFNSFQIPTDAESGEYTFKINYDWENFGPGLNESFSFDLIDVKGTFNSSIGRDPIFLSNTTYYNISLENKWSEGLTNLDVSINCPSELSCSEKVSEPTNLTSGSETEVSYNVTAPTDANTDLYTVNATIEYQNPDETRTWDQVEPQTFKVTTDEILVTTIESKLPEKIVRGETLGINGSLKNNNNQASDVWLNYTLPSQWDTQQGTDKFWETVSSGEKVWNNITAEITLAANKGEQEIRLQSNNSDGARSDFDLKEVTVYSNTSITLDINDTETVQGNEVSINATLEEDTGNLLSDQTIIFQDNKSGDELGRVPTDSLGKASIDLEVPMDWEVGNHSIQAIYRGNNTLYTAEAKESKNLQIYDKPNISSFTADPSLAGLGRPVQISAEVYDEDGVKNVEARLTNPSGKNTVIQMTNSSSEPNVFTGEFSTGWANGDYKYRIQAQDEEDVTALSQEKYFELGSNASLSVTTTQDVYGPYKQVSLERDSPVELNNSEEFWTLTSEYFIRDLFSEEFNTVSGGAAQVQETHNLDNSYFEMTQTDGGFSDNIFEGTYTYSTKLKDLSEITFDTYGNVTGSTWNIDVRNYNSQTWDAVTSVTTTSPAWNNATICTSGCNNYISNGEIEIRVTASTGGFGQDPDTYGVDFQRLTVTAQDGVISEKEKPVNVKVGQENGQKKRYSSRFTLSELPFHESGQIQSADLLINVTSGSGTGEIYNVKNFYNYTDSENIHSNSAPTEATQSNPVNTFTATQGLKTIDITQSVQNTFDTGKKNFSYQIREQNEDEVFQIERPVYILINYTTNSELYNRGTTGLSGSLVIKVQRNSSTGWTDVKSIPTVNPSDGIFDVDSGNALNLSRIWKENGAFNTGIYSSGQYRVLASMEEGGGGKTLVSEDGIQIRNTYNFRIGEAQPRLSEISHENLEQSLVNEYGVKDVIDWINVTISNSEFEAAEAKANLSVIGEFGNPVTWGPNSEKLFGNISAGDSVERRWDNSGNGYQIPLDASSKVFTFRWKTILDAENAKERVNSSLTFQVYNVPENFTSEISDSDNRINRNDSVFYNFSVYNPWSQDLQKVNVTVNCDTSQLSCEERGGSSETYQLGNISSGITEEASFNISTDPSTDTIDYDINATVEYRNPGGELKTWNQYRNKILRVRVPGSFLNVTDTPNTAVRGDSGYEFRAYANNTYKENLTNHAINWSIPDGWNNVTGSLDVLESEHEPGEIVWNNFTAGLDSTAKLGERRINISTDNDEGRIDSDFAFIEVNSPTNLQLETNETDPAANETIRLKALLRYENGTAIEGEPVEFRDQRTASTVGTTLTNSTGYATIEYDPARPYRNHSINATYSGSDALYTLSSSDTKNITVHDRPNITNVSANPSKIGFGYNTTINATVTDRDGLSEVDVRIYYPNLTKRTFDMVNPSGDTWRYEFDDTWQFGNYSFQVIANDSFNKQGVNTSSFSVDITQLSSIKTQQQEYSPNEDVNLTDYQEAWWDRDWDYRQKIQVTENSGNKLVKYPVKLSLSNLSGRTYSCADLRVIEDNQLQDFYIETCNPSGQTELYVSTNVSASATESDLYVYYENSEASEYTRETFGYRINDSGTYDPGQTDIDQVFSYNDEEAIFRNVDLTFSGDYDSVTVQGYHQAQEQYTTLYSGTGTSFSDTYYQNPRFSRIRVQMQGTGDPFSTNPSFAYNFTTPRNADTEALETQDLLPSLIENIGNNDFKGRLFLQVSRNESGTWQPVSTRYNETTPTEIQADTFANLADLWNTDPWNTGLNPAGQYRAGFKLLNPSGKVLEDSGGPIFRTNTFRLNEPASDVRIQDIKVYNVSKGNPQGSTTYLEDSGLNSTLKIYGGEQYRFDIEVENTEDAQANWTIDSGVIVEQTGLNSSWRDQSIFYNVSGTQYTGGSFDGTVTWNTQGGELSPGDNATFSYVIDIPNNQSYRDINFGINDTAFVRADKSDLQVVKAESQAPSPLSFNLSNKTITRGDSLSAWANWTEEIGSAQAEYNVTSPVLVNNTVNPQGTWTNYSLSTTSEWIRGEHAFRFYASDLNGNTGKTVQKFFEVFGIASVTDSKFNSSRVKRGETSKFSCRVKSDSGDAVSSYNVTFVNVTGGGAEVLGSRLTNSTGWASIDYSSTSLGYKDLTCGIQENESKYFYTGQDSMTRQLRVVEEEPPKWENFNTNASRIFRTLNNTTLKATSFWTDNEQLDKASIVEGNSTADGLTVPEPKLLTKQLSGNESWANFTLDVRKDYPLKDTNITIYGNDTSSNINGTSSEELEIWGWSRFGGSSFEDNPVGQNVEAVYACQVGLGNGSVLNGYEVSFYDNSTADGSWKFLGNNTSAEIGGVGGVAEYSKLYSSTGDYRWKCNMSSSQSKNIEPYPGDNSRTKVLTVSTGDVEPPVIIGGNYGLNDSAVYRGLGEIKSFARWNETIDYSYVEYNTTNSSYSTEKVPEPYTDRWTNYTLQTGPNWSVGPHEIKTYANDTVGNLNDTLEYLEYNVYGRAEVKWLSPTGTVEQGMNQLRCGVESVYGSGDLEDYTVTFFTGQGSVGSNNTNSNGVAVYNYNSTQESTGDKTWSCAIGDEPSLYYNASSNDSDSEQITLVEDIAATVSGNLTSPEDGAVLAQNKTFATNVTIQCSNGDCGEVNASLRYNSTGLTPDTEVPESSGQPFHTIGSNAKTCNLGQGENCTVNFEVNATGQQNQDYSLDAQIRSPNAKTNDTENVEVKIDVVLITDFNYSEVNFDGEPGQVVPAPGNSEGSYSFSLSESSNDATGVWIKMTNLSQVEGSDEIRPMYTKWELDGPCSDPDANGANNLTNSYSEMRSELNAGTTLTQCYWQEIPFAKNSGNYIGTMSIKVNTTE